MKKVTVGGVRYKCIEEGMRNLGCYGCVNEKKGTDACVEFPECDGIIFVKAERQPINWENVIDHTLTYAGITSSKTDKNGELMTRGNIFSPTFYVFVFFVAIAVGIAYFVDNFYKTIIEIVGGSFRRRREWKQ